MKGNKTVNVLLALGVFFLLFGNPVHARIKMVALPERGKTIIRLDNPRATLIEEERVLTLQKGLNKVDFSWKGVSIDVDSIRLTVLTQPEEVTLLNVSYPPQRGGTGLGNLQSRCFRSQGSNQLSPLSYRSADCIQRPCEQGRNPDESQKLSGPPQFFRGGF